MKILIVGSGKRWAMSKFYFDHLTQQNINVAMFEAPDMFSSAYNRSLLSKVKLRLNAAPLLKKINEELLAQVRKDRIDVVWVFKGMELLPETLIQLKKEGVFLINYNADHPFMITSKGGGNKYVTQSVGLYDLHFSYNKKVIAKIEEDYGLPTYWLPFGFNLDREAYEEVAKTEEQLDVCFVGNPDKIRAELIEKILDEGIAIHVYGIGWNKWLSDHPQLHIHEVVINMELNKVLRKYRVQLNIFRPHNSGSHNMRTFEVPAVGGIMLAPDSPEHLTFFEEGKEAFFYKNYEELIEKIRLILNLPKEEADRIRQNARNCSLNHKYSYYNRTEEVIDVLKKNLSLKKDTISG